VSIDDHLACLVQVAATAWIPETTPQRQQLTEWGVCALAWRRIRLDEGEELGHDPIDLGLLRHHFTDEDVPAIARRSPRQFTKLRKTPCEQGVDESCY
jgi:hypothetical protein